MGLLAQPPSFLQVVLGNRKKEAVLSSHIHFQCRRDVFEKRSSLRFTGCGCSCFGFSILSYVINSSSVLRDYFLKGNFCGSRK